MAGLDDSPRLTFATTDDFRTWVGEHVDDAAGVWLQIAKKGSGVPSVTYSEALDVALCFGWIDGLKRGYDETYFLQRFTPRRARSRWSKNNVVRVEALIAAGLMTPTGQAEVDKAQGDGRWEAAYEPASTAQVPADLQAALDANPAAAAAFVTVTAASRYAVIFRVTGVTRPETRARAIDRYVTMLADGGEPHPKEH